MFDSEETGEGTATASPPLHALAPQLSSSHVRSVDTSQRLMSVPRLKRRAFQRKHGLDTSNPPRWPHEARMAACAEFEIDPVLGVGGTKYAREHLGWEPSAAHIDLPDEEASEAERALSAVAEDDELEEDDPFADLIEPANRSSIFIKPSRDPNFYVADSTKNLLRVVEKLSRTRPVNVAMRGPTGTGKTSLPEWYADRTNRPLFIFDTPTIRETQDAFGMRTIERDEHGEARVVLQLSGLLQAVQTPRACIVIDEATRAHASILNGLLALLDHRKRVWLDALQAHIEVADGVVFFVTANIGAAYTGTWIWDAAFENRMDYQIDVGYLPEPAEIGVLTAKTGVDVKVAKPFVQIANITRKRLDDSKEPLPHAISTRQLLRAAEAVVAGLSPTEALEYTVVPTYSSEGGTSSDRAHVLQIIQGKLAA